MKTQLIILRGNSGSGKTSVASALQKKLGPGTLLVSQDVVRREMLGVKDGPHSLGIALIGQLARYGNNRVETVIVEGILRADWYGEMLRDLAGEFDRCFSYYFELTFAETLKRHQKKAKRAEFGEAQMRRWWLEKDYLDLEGEQRLDEKPDLEALVSQIIRDIQGG